MVGGILGGPIGGYIYDVTVSYDLAFLFVTVLLVIAAGLPFLMRRSDNSIPLELNK